jgi:hypothetical protein
MRLSQWLTLIGVVAGLGCLQVAQRNALFMAGYAFGEQAHAVHTQEANLLWLNAQVVGLESPKHLSRMAQERNLQLVAWSTLPAPSLMHVAAMHHAHDSITSGASD